MSDLWHVLTVITTFLIGLPLVVIAVEAITEIMIAGALLDIVGFRPWLARKALPIDGDFNRVRWYHTASYKLFSCGYCASVWVSVVLAWFLPGRYVGLLPWDNIVVKVFVVHRLANYWHIRYELLRRGRVNMFDVELKLPEVKLNVESQTLNNHLSGLKLPELKLSDATVEANDAREIARGDGTPGATSGQPNFSTTSS